MDELVALADYRRQVAGHYLAPGDGAAGCAAFRAARERLFLTHPASALDPVQQVSGTGPSYLPYDPAAVVGTRLETAAGEVSIDTGGEDGVARYRRIGRMSSRYGQLTLFWLLGYGGGLFLPFRDVTSGTETYGGGRYLTDTIKGTFGRGVVLDGTRVTLDFNYAYNPSCAYNPHYACPLAPPENRLDRSVLAGERAYPGPQPAS
jgi:uncharacterized protein (DUF1684 family)